MPLDDQQPDFARTEGPLLPVDGLNYQYEPRPEKIILRPFVIDHVA
jgi:hypothetical protein